MVVPKKHQDGCSTNKIKNWKLCLLRQIKIVVKFQKKLPKKANNQPSICWSKKSCPKWDRNYIWIQQKLLHGLCHLLYTQILTWELIVDVQNKESKMSNTKRKLFQNRKPFSEWHLRWQKIIVKMNLMLWMKVKSQPQMMKENHLEKKIPNLHQEVPS